MGHREAASAVRIVALGNGAAGAEKQALALSARLQAHLTRAGAQCVGGSELVRVPMHPHRLTRSIPPIAQFAAARLLRDPFFGYSVSSEVQQQLLRSDGVRVVIGCGRTTVSLCAALKALAPAAADGSSNVFNIQIQHPRVPLKLFDAVIIPRHDVAPSSAVADVPTNVHLTYGTVCTVDANPIDHQVGDWENALRGCVQNKRVRLVWLIGGPCRGFSFSVREARAMVDEVLAGLHHHRPHASLLVTFSRRTPVEAQAAIQHELQRTLQDRDELFIWDGQGANPYDALLHHATAIVTTPDSISMTTEAIATGKPVFTVCAHSISGKFHSFHDALFKHEFTAPLTAGAVATPSCAATSLGAGKRALEKELDAITAHLTTQVLLL